MITRIILGINSSTVSLKSVVTEFSGSQELSVKAINSKFKFRLYYGPKLWPSMCSRPLDASVKPKFFKLINNTLRVLQNDRLGGRIQNLKPTS